MNTISPNALKHALILIAVTTLSAFAAPKAFAIDTVIVDTFGYAKNVELTLVDKKVTIFNDTIKSSHCNTIYNAYATLQSDGNVRMQYRIRSTIAGIVLDDQSSFTTLAIGGVDSRSYGSCAGPGEALSVDFKIRRGHYTIACMNSLSAGHVISQQSSTKYTYTTYFSSKATLTDHTSSTCTYTGDITTKYSTPLASGTSTYNGSTTIALEDVSALYER